MDDNEEVFDYLEHFGVKGMRWGKRKSGDSSSGEAPAKPKKFTKTEVNVEASRRRAGAFAKLAEDYDLDVYMRPLRKGNVSFYAEFKNHVSDETARAMNEAFKKSMKEVDESLVADGYKKK